MTNYNAEQIALDRAMDDEHMARGLGVLGYFLLGFASLPAVFIFTGWRSGSMFWFWYTVAIGFCGMVLVGAAKFYSERAVRRAARILRPIIAEELPPATTERVEGPADHAA